MTRSNATRSSSDGCRVFVEKGEAELPGLESSTQARYRSRPSVAHTATAAEAATAGHVKETGRLCYWLTSSFDEELAVDGRDDPATGFALFHLLNLANEKECLLPLLRLPVLPLLSENASSCWVAELGT